MQEFGTLAQEAGPAYAYTYYAHAAIGFGAAALGLVALVSRKSGVWHRRAGQVFIAAMTFAAVTALYFFATRVPGPPVLMSALVSLYGMGMAILSLKPRTGGWFALQVGLVAVPFLVGLIHFASIAAAIYVPQIPIYLVFLAPFAGALFLIVGWRDIQFLRAGEVDRGRRLRRHAFRMALVCLEVVRAPLQSFGPRFLGEENSFQFYAFAPYILLPLILWLAVPAWLKARAPEPATA